MMNSQFFSKGNEKMSDYENWNGSRWEFTKSRSNWHFDRSRPSELGPDSYTPICRFNADFAAAIDACLPRTKPSSWSSRNDFNKDIAAQGLYSANAEERDLIAAGADPKQEVFNRSAAEDVELFQKIADVLGMEDNMIKFHNQTTGQMLHLHIDNFAARPERENSFKVTDFDKEPEVMRRFAVMLADWEMGQTWMFGNTMYWGWKAGDCITWEWQDMPHATVNAGWHNRPLLQITGRVTEKTQWLLDKAKADIGKPLSEFTV